MLSNSIKCNYRRVYGLRKYTSQSNVQHERKSLSSENIRNIFLDYFTLKQQHQFIRSSSVVPFSDGTVPFVVAGMHQFKNIFLDKAEPPCKTAVNSQKCIRIGGKHNDLDVVGTDGYHHTFFEMLGNWSFGDYFKERACKMAWDLLTNEYRIDPSRLYVTYFSGNEEMGIGADIECKEIWRRIGVPEERILPFGEKENFWYMGPISPCGPCTEIHIDHLPNSLPAKRARYVNAGCPDLTELWNVVFIQYFRNDDGSFTTLKQQHIDTGMGFERLVAILQGKSSNYDTDLFVPIFDAIARETRVTPYGGSFDPSQPNYELDVAYRVLADHARMCAIAIADGMFLNQTHRLLHVFRKTINIADKVFKAPHILQKAVIPQIVQSLGATYPELDKNYDRILKVVSHEADAYRSLLKKSSKNFKKLNLRPDSRLTEIDALQNAGLVDAFKYIDSQLKANPQLHSLSAENLYYLHVTFGLNEEMLESVAYEKGLSVQMDEFEKYSNEQKRLLKQKLALKVEPHIQELRQKQLPKTDDNFKYSYEYNAATKCYDLPTIDANVVYVAKAKASDLHHIVLDKTNFYATAGGQDSDIGEIRLSNGNEMDVFDVETVEYDDGLVVHGGRFRDGTKRFTAGATVTLCVNNDRRTSSTQHHTGTHLFQAAVKHITGKIIFQNASHVSAENMKFDMGIIGDRLTNEEVEKIKEFIRTLISSSIEVKTKMFSTQELSTCEGITTVPGAIYPDSGIRIIAIEEPSSKFLSLEPCCGTHIKRTSDLERFCITSIHSTKLRTLEITAVCGRRAETVYQNGLALDALIESLRARVDANLSESQLYELVEDIRQMRGSLYTNDLPFTNKGVATRESETMQKAVNTKLRTMIRKWIKADLNEALSQCAGSAKPCIVHFIRSQLPLEPLLLRDATELTKDVPTIVFNVCDQRMIGGRAIVPQKFVNENFDSGKWMSETLNSAQIDAVSGDGTLRGGYSICNLLKIPSEDELFDAEKITQIQELARSIAVKNM